MNSDSAISKTPLLIRACRTDEIPWLRTMTAAAFGGVSIDHGIEKEFGLVNGHDWQWRKMRHVDEDFARDPQGIFIAESEITGKAIGYISTWIDQEAGIGHIPNLVVDAAYRGLGIGRLLLLHALDHFRNCGMTLAKIETLVQNEVGNGLYQSLGFREVARQIHFAMSLTNTRQPNSEG